MPQLKQALASKPYLDLKDREPNEAGKYVLLVFRPIPFGMGLMTFFVDDLRDTPNPQGNVIERYALNGDRVVVRFPASFDFMLVDRNEFEFREPEAAEEGRPMPEQSDRLGPISHL